MYTLTALEYLYRRGRITYTDYRNTDTYAELDEMIQDYYGYATFADYLFVTDPDTYAKYYC